MLEKLFKPKRKDLFEQRDNALAQGAAKEAKHRAEIEALEADPDYRSYCRALEIQRNLTVLRERYREAASAAQQKIREIENEIRAQDGGKIRVFIRWAQDEKERAGKQIVSRGLVERDRLGMPVGHIITNEKKISEYVDAVDEAINAAKRLELSPSDDVDAEIRNIRSALPMLDAQPEQIDCDAGFAAALS